jgi:hypothetical protein
MRTITDNVYKLYTMGMITSNQPSLIGIIPDSVYKMYTIGRVKLAGVFKGEVWYLAEGVVGGWPRVLIG